MQQKQSLSAEELQRLDDFLISDSSPPGSIPLDELHGFLSALDTTRAKVGRNDPCPCGSGRKFKKCCGSARD